MSVLKCKADPSSQMHLARSIHWKDKEWQIAIWEGLRHTTSRYKIYDGCHQKYTNKRITNVDDGVGSLEGVNGDENRSRKDDSCTRSAAH